jgi:Cysteine-rich CPCC
MQSTLFTNCPCCGLPTLGEPDAYEICVVCWWEDDGHDDNAADKVWGGPNGSYSLTVAKSNFLDHGHMYDLGQGIEVVENPSAARIVLVDYALGVLRGMKALDCSYLTLLMQRERDDRQCNQ